MLAASALNGTFVGMLSGAQELMVSLLHCDSYVTLSTVSILLLHICTVQYGDNLLLCTACQFEGGGVIASLIQMHTITVSCHFPFGNLIPPMRSTYSRSHTYNVATLFPFT